MSCSARQTESIAAAQDPVQRGELADLLARAFEHDAHINWFVRQDAARAPASRQFFDLLLGDLLEPHGKVVATGDRKAAAIWFPPVGWKPGLLQQAGVGLRFARVTGWRNLPSRALELHRMAARHPPEPHYFLQTIGVAPECRGQGHGSALLRTLLEHCDADGVGAYLETSREGNLAFYERHGFRVIGTAWLPDGPMLYRLFRQPASTSQDVMDGAGGGTRTPTPCGAGT